MKKLIILAFAALGMLACTEPNNPQNIKEGALSGVFSVSASTKVQFSQGNLQYQATTDTWRFAEHQWNFVGGVCADSEGNVYMDETLCDNSEISSYYSGWIDLFGWGTGNNPTLSAYYRDYWDEEDNHIYDDEGAYYNNYGTFTDWGVNPIVNGGNKADMWRTLTGDEWLYLFHGRPNADMLFGLGSVNGVNGIIILPDSWTTPSGIAFYASTVKGFSWVGGEDRGYYYEHDIYYQEFGEECEEKHYLDNVYTPKVWQKMENAGAVFLPAAGIREGLDVEDCCQEVGIYWSSTPTSDGKAGVICCGSEVLYPQIPHNRSYGQSVRLVQDVE